jgi:hypothetical protein
MIEGRPREIKSFKEQFFLRPKALQCAQDNAARVTPAKIGQAHQQVQSGDKRDIARVLARTRTKVSGLTSPLTASDKK